MGGVWGSWFGVLLVVLVLISQFYIAVVSLYSSRIQLSFRN